MLGIKGTGDGKKQSKEQLNKLAVKKRVIWLSMLAIVVTFVVVTLSLGFLKSIYADYSKGKLQEFVKVWEPVQNTNDETIESDITKLNTETMKIRQEVGGKAAPINSQKLKTDIMGFFDYAETFTTDMHKDFQWSKDLSEISGGDDEAILAIDLNDGTKSLQSAITLMDNNIAKMDSMVVSSQVAEAHKQFRDSVAEESVLYKKLLTTINSNDVGSINEIATEIKVFNEKFGKMSGPSSALTIAYTIKTKEFEIKIDRLGKEIDRASNIWTNNFY